MYANIEALVYEEPEVEAEDSTIPDSTHQDGRIHQYVEQLTEIFGAVNMKMCC